MTATLLYRIAAGLLLLGTVSHTIGVLVFRPSSPEGMAVHEAMSSVHITVQGAVRSYAAFHRGLGFLVTAYMLLGTFLAWHLATAAANEPQTAGALAWVFAAVQLACFLVYVRYFFLVPVLVSGAITVCVLWAAWLLRSLGA